jgi:hypothetical protein
VTKDDFRKLFQLALNTAANNIDKHADIPVARSFLIDLHAPGFSGQAVSFEEALDHLYLGDNLFYKIIDVAIEELRSRESVVFVRVSGHPPTDFDKTCDPAGLGPFKHVLAAHVNDRRPRENSAREPIGVIVGEKLSGVNFVLDYWQLQFDGPIITVWTRIEVAENKSVLRDGDDQFRNLLCSQIGKIVEHANVTREDITITFADRSSISLSLRERDLRGPDGVLIQGPGGMLARYPA